MSKRHGYKSSLSLLCGTTRDQNKLKGKPSKVEAQANDKTNVQFPLPIDELVDYTDHQQEQIRQQHAEPNNREVSSTSDSEQISVKSGVQASVFVQSEASPAKTLTSMSVKRAEGIAIKSDRSNGKETRQGLSILQNLMFEDTPDQEVVVAKSAAPLNESAVPVTARSNASLGQSVTETARSQRSSADPSDVQALKRTVRRLTAELSRLLTAPRADGKTIDEVDTDKLLPGKGPLPPWLCDPRVFAPLMSAYEHQLASVEKGGKSDATNGQLRDMEVRVQEVVSENERLRLKLREAAVAEPASLTEYDAFTEQARLVLEENQLLIQQLSVQQAKAKLAQRQYLEEAAKLKCRIEELEAENAQVRGEFESLHGKLQEVKQKYHSAALERETGEMQTVDRMRSLSKELLDTREEFVRANEELLRQLQKSEREKVKLTQSLTDAITERDSLRIEVSELRSAIQLKHKEFVQLQKSSKKRDSLQEYLESVVNEATNIQEELDTCKEKLEKQETELRTLVGFLVYELRFQEKSDGQDKIPNLTAKFEFLIKRFAALLKRNEGKREEMVKQICYLQALIREKSQQLQVLEAENTTVAAGLETVWNTAATN